MLVAGSYTTDFPDERKKTLKFSLAGSRCMRNASIPLLTAFYV